MIFGDEGGNDEDVDEEAVDGGIEDVDPNGIDFDRVSGVSGGKTFLERGDDENDDNVDADANDDDDDDDDDEEKDCNVDDNDEEEDCNFDDDDDDDFSFGIINDIDEELFLGYKKVNGNSVCFCFEEELEIFGGGIVGIGDLVDKVLK